MNNEDLKAALLNRENVIYEMLDGSTAEMTVFGIVYRSNGRGGITVSAELLDKNGKSITYCNPKNIRRKDNAKRKN